jgi:glutathione peroxidase
MSSVYDFEMTSLSGDAMPFSQFSGKVALLVNVASACGLTPQYTALQKLQETYADQGFSVIGLPCNQFGAQEPGTPDEIQEFCSRNCSVPFPLTSKIFFNDTATTEIYTHLTSTFPGDIEWNFGKFLIGKDGQVVQRIDPKTAPDDPGVISAIEAALSS